VRGVGLAESQLHIWNKSELKFSITDKREACLLGAPLSAVGVDEALKAKGAQLRDVTPRLRKLASHEAYYLLKSCFAIPRLQYLLRCSPVFASPGRWELDDIIKETLSSILNTQLDEDIWTQASLPVRWGGLGVRNVSSLAMSAFLSSLHATEPLVQAMLPLSFLSSPDPLAQTACTSWIQVGGLNLPQGVEASRQRSWDDVICGATYDHLLMRADQSSRARLLAVASPDAGAWLQVLPCRNLGLCLSDREVRVAIGLRFGAPLVAHIIVYVGLWLTVLVTMAFHVGAAPDVIVATLKPMKSNWYELSERLMSRQI